MHKIKVWGRFSKNVEGDPPIEFLQIKWYSHHGQGIYDFEILKSYILCRSISCLFASRIRIQSAYVRRRSARSFLLDQLGVAFCQLKMVEIANSQKNNRFHLIEFDFVFCNLGEDLLRSSLSNASPNSGHHLQNRIADIAVCVRSCLKVFSL